MTAIAATPQCRYPTNTKELVTSPMNEIKAKHKYVFTGILLYVVVNPYTIYFTKSISPFSQLNSKQINDYKRVTTNYNNFYNSCNTTIKFAIPTITIALIVNGEHIFSPALV